MILINALEPVRDDFFGYLCGRLSSRALLVTEFSRLVLGMSHEEALKRVMPSILPKLVLQASSGNKDFGVRDKVSPLGPMSSECLCTF